MDKNTIIETPWGHYQKYYDDGGVWVKIMTINPHECTSLQRHEKRNEWWMVIEGEAHVTEGEYETKWKKYETITIPRLRPHRLSNKTTKPIRVLEVAYGEVDENDIERIADEYGR
jgi:mannose-1-phosphate guanylyltransferase/mannose-6-phosphate isomerase